MQDVEHIYHGEFSDVGFAGPFRFLTQPQARFLGRHWQFGPRRRAVWPKALAITDPLVCRLARNPKLVQILRWLIGDDIVLWGASFVGQTAQKIHPWHCDIESCAPEGGFASVWIGLINTGKESGINFIRGSHKYGATIQELAARDGIKREGRTDEYVLRLANSQQPEAEIVQPEIGNGEAVIFDGRIWHGSRNTLTDESRISLLLQYACADREIRIPDMRNRDPDSETIETAEISKTIDVEWPFRYVENRPPVISIAGSVDSGPNIVVRPPAMRLADELQPSAHQIDRKLRCDEGQSFKPVPCFTGRTNNAEYVECHYSVLMPGASPHAPHTHLEEEILIVMNGGGELVVPGAGQNGTTNILPAPAGSAIHYPSYQPHTIRNASNKPVIYAMIKWKSAIVSAGKHLGPFFMKSSWLEQGGTGRLVSMKRILEAPSAFLAKLHMHVTRIEPGGSYNAHRDLHDVAIFLIHGDIEVIGKNITAPAVVFLPGGCLHGMRAAGTETAKYIVWEFHARPATVARQTPPGAASNIAAQ